MLIAIVSYACCKSRSGCCICCNGYRRILQPFVPNVSVVSDICCTCFIWVLHTFHIMLQVVNSDVAYVLQWLHTCFPRVSDLYCKCFQLFWTYVANVSSRYYKIRSGVAHVAVGPINSSLPAGMCVDVEGARAVGAGNRAGVDRMERRGTRCGCRPGAARAPT
jgi:hypothetical protein